MHIMNPNLLQGLDAAATMSAFLISHEYYIFYALKSVGSNIISVIWISLHLTLNANSLLFSSSNASQATGPADNTRLDHRNNIPYFFACCCPDLRLGR
jgi:hypothetical protein